MVHYGYSSIHSYMSLLTAVISILNHGYTYKLLKIIDRSMFFTMCLININNIRTFIGVL